MADALPLTQAERVQVKAQACYVATDSPDEMRVNLRTFFGPCFVCGAELYDQRTDNEQVQRDYDALKLLALRDDPLTVPDRNVCRDCQLKSESAYQREEAHRERQNLVNQGLVSDRAVFDERFDTSDSAKESLNAIAWAKVRDWQPGMCSLYFYGPWGTGKTYAANCCLNLAFDQGLSIADLFAGRFTELVGRYAKDRRKWIHALGRVGVLFLDEMDKGMWTPETVMAFHEIVSVRRRKELSTILAANRDTVGEGGLYAQLEEAVKSNKSLVQSAFDRLHLPSRNVMKVYFDGPSQRRVS